MIINVHIFHFPFLPHGLSAIIYSQIVFFPSAGFLSFLLSVPTVYADINPGVLNGPGAQSCLQKCRSVKVS